MNAISVTFDDRNIPATLKEEPNWIGWKAVPNGDCIEKIPVNPSTGHYASSTNPDTWTDYSTAAKIASTQDGVGLGFVFKQAGGIVGIDLDKCRDPDTGAVTPWADEIVRTLNSYTEVSPSGKGLHVYVRGTLPPGKRKRGQVEAYEQGRFFTVTGQYLAGTPPTIEERTAELRAFHAQFLADPERPPPLRTVSTTGRGRGACLMATFWRNAVPHRMPESLHASGGAIGAATGTPRNLMETSPYSAS